MPIFWFWDPLRNYWYLHWVCCLQCWMRLLLIYDDNQKLKELNNLLFWKDLFYEAIYITWSVNLFQGEWSIRFTPTAFRFWLFVFCDANKTTNWFVKVPWTSCSKEELLITMVEASPLAALDFLFLNKVNGLINREGTLTPW